MMIRRMTENDIDAVLELKAGEFQPAWNRDMLMSELKDNPFAQAYVLTKNDKIIGFLDFWITFETAQLANIAIETNRHRQGLGSLLMNEMLEICEKEMCEMISLEVHVNNQTAISFYEHYGFIKASLRKGYYEDGCDAHLMIKPLGGNYV